MCVCVSVETLRLAEHVLWTEHISELAFTLVASSWVPPTNHPKWPTAGHCVHGIQTPHCVLLVPRPISSTIHAQATSAAAVMGMICCRPPVAHASCTQCAALVAVLTSGHAGRRWQRPWRKPSKSWKRPSPQATRSTTACSRRG
jgi:hypothetical protein